MTICYFNWICGGRVGKLCAKVTQDVQKLTELMANADVNLKFKLIDVPLEELQSERETMARSEYGYDP